jgi:integrase
MKIKTPKVKDLEYVKDGKKYHAYQVVWTDRNGKRQRKQFTDRSEAALCSSETHTQLLNDGHARRNFSTSLSETALREAEACVLRLGDKYRLTDCVDYYLKHFQDPAFKITVGDAAAKFRTAKEGVIRPRSFGQFSNTLTRFERFTDNRNVHEVTTETVEGFLHTLRAKDGVHKATHKTWNNYRTELHLFLEWCKAKPQRYITENPASDVKRFKIDKGDIDTLNADTCKNLMQYVENFKGGKLARYFAIQLFAGVRPGELSRLAAKAVAIDLDNAVIKLSAAMTKTREARQITTQPNLREWLSRYDGDIIPRGHEDAANKVREKFALTRDVLRHTFITMHIMAFDSFAQTAIQSGNTEQIIRKHYLNASTKADALKFWNIFPEGGEAKVVPFAQTA